MTWYGRTEWPAIGAATHQTTSATRCTVIDPSNHRAPRSTCRTYPPAQPGVFVSSSYIQPRCRPQALSLCSSRLLNSAALLPTPLPCLRPLRQACSSKVRPMTRRYLQLGHVRIKFLRFALHHSRLLQRLFAGPPTHSLGLRYRVLVQAGDTATKPAHDTPMSR